MNAVSLISLLTLFIALSARFISSLGRPRGDSHKRGVLIVQASAVQKLAAHAKRSRLGWLTARFTPDGRQLFVLRDSGDAERWDVDPDAWSEHACRVAGRELTRAEWSEFVPGHDYRRVCGS